MSTLDVVLCPACVAEVQSVLHAIDDDRYLSWECRACGYDLGCSDEDKPPTLRRLLSGDDEHSGEWNNVNLSRLLPEVARRLGVKP